MAQVTNFMGVTVMDSKENELLKDENKFDSDLVVDRSRRSIAKAGAVVPAILTLVSRPALAGACFSPSRALSVNHSVRPGDTIPECNGESPGNYKAQPNSYQTNKDGTYKYNNDDTPKLNQAYNWPSSVPSNTPFHPTFSGSHFKYNGKTLTMLEVLSLNDGATYPLGYPKDPDNVAMHIIAAYLNILNGYIPSEVLTVGMVQDMWTQYSTTGVYYPISSDTSVTWNGAQIVSYLVSNTIAP